MKARTVFKPLNLAVFIFGGLAMIPARLVLPSKKEGSARGHTVQLHCCLPPPRCFQQIHHLEQSAAEHYIMISILLLVQKHIRKRKRDGEAAAQKRLGRCVAEDDSRGCFCMKECFLPTLPLCSSLPLFLFRTMSLLPPAKR